MPECGLAYHWRRWRRARNEPFGGIRDFVSADAVFGQPRAVAVGVLHRHELGQIGAAAQIVAGTADHQHLDVVVDAGAVQQVGVADAGPRWSAR